MSLHLIKSHLTFDCFCSVDSYIRTLFETSTLGQLYLLEKFFGYTVLYPTKPIKVYEH